MTRLICLFAALLLAACGPDASSGSSPAATDMGDGTPIASASAPPGSALQQAQALAAAAPAPAGAEPLDWSYFGDDGVLELDWLQLLPEDELEALSRPRNIRHEGTMREAQEGSDRVVPAVLGYPVRLPGYVVPLETDAQGRVVELFLVPYYGACIHVPPPPPNQIIHITLADPVRVDDIFEPFWIEGTLRDAPVVNDIAGTAYSMQGAGLVAYSN